jgi:hypothetical protein
MVYIYLPSINMLMYFAIVELALFSLFEIQRIKSLYVTGESVNI